MKITEIRELTNEELARALAEKRKELFSMRIRAKTGQLENPAAIRQVRRTIARLTMVQAQKQK